MTSQIPATYLPFHKKRIDLGRNLIVLEFSVVLIYFVLHFILDFRDPIYIYLGFFSIILVQLCLYRWGLFLALSVFSLTSFNIAIFLAASSESRDTGLYLHFISAGTAALVIFGYRDWRKGIFFASFSFACFLLLHLTSISLLPTRVYTPSQLTLFFLMNICTMTAASASCILLLLKINFASERSLRENQIVIERKNEELKKTNAELDRFVYSASHDLRAPLSSISGLVQIMQQADRPTTEKYLNMIQNRVEAMDKFISEIIDYSRNARVDVTLQAICLKSLLDEVWENLNYFQGANQIKFISEVDHDLMLESDPYRLKVILNNLLTNAIKYADHRKDSYVRISSNRMENCLEIHVEDNGIGIHPDHQGKVFEMFYRATESSKGSGLGLYIVQEVVHKMNGVIGLNSQLGKGSSFVISLPDRCAAIPAS